MSRASLVLPFLGACFGGTDDTMMYVPDCESTRVPVAWDDPAPLGQSPDELVAASLGSFTAPGTWLVDGAATEVTVTFAKADGESPARIDVSGSDLAMCPSSVEIPLSVQLSTADGGLDVAFDAPWVLEWTDEGLGITPFGAGALVEPAGNAGTYTGADVLGPNDELRGFHVSAGLDEAGAAAGAVTVEFTGEDADAAWDGFEDVFTFGAE